jgi:hypothetical protein
MTGKQLLRGVHVEYTAKADSKAVWLDEVEAPDEAAAMEKAARLIERQVIETFMPLNPSPKRRH